MRPTENKARIAYMRSKLKMLNSNTDTYSDVIARCRLYRYMNERRGKAALRAAYNIEVII